MDFCVWVEPKMALARTWCEKCGELLGKIEEDRRMEFAI